VSQVSNRYTRSEWLHIERQLDLWFAEGHARHSFLPYHASQIPEALALFACSLYKRGAAGIVEIESGIQKPAPARRQKQIQEHHKSYQTWDEFFSAELKMNGDIRGYTVIADAKVAELHPLIAARCGAEGVRIIRVAGGENNKNLNAALELCEQLDQECREVVVVGGGLTCDLAAFAAALLGLKITLVPTTLLALVDAGLGGKTAVNHPIAGKNQIGLFSEIQSVVCVRDTLTTLSSLQLREGCGEILKHAWLSGRFAEWKVAVEKIFSTHPAAAFQDPDVINLISENVNFKQAVVAVDPFEENLRVLLNLGHTLAHMLEGLNISASGRTEKFNELSHGVAVALGLHTLLKCGLLRRAPEGYIEALEAICGHLRAKFPLFTLAQDEVKALRLLRQDKKNSAAPLSDSVRCVLPEYGELALIPDATDAGTTVARSVRNIPATTLLQKIKESGVFA
jgi:3-dehydroquinate synthase